MSGDASVEFVWGDGRHRFRLALGQLRELQEKTGVGPMRLLVRIFEGDWKADDFREIIRLGLIGGGAKPVEATKLIERYVDARPLMESKEAATSILGAALLGIPDDPVGKPEAEWTGTQAESQMAASSSPPSMAPAAS